MRALIQRVLSASVHIDGNEKSSIGEGMLIFIGIEDADNREDIQYMCRKAANLRIFDDEKGIMNQSILQTGGEVLVVSQFTLFADTRKGNRPSYIRASKPDFAIPIYEEFCSSMSQILQQDVKTGEFGADMQVSIVNDGPVTIWIDSKEK